MKAAPSGCPSSHFDPPQRRHTWSVLGISGPGIGYPPENFVRLYCPYHVHPADDTAHALHPIGMARIRGEHHEPDLPVGKEVKGEMPVSASLPLSPECCRRCNGDRRAPKLGLGPQEEEHLTQRIGRGFRPSLTFLFERAHQENQPLRQACATGQTAASSKRSDLPLNLPLRRPKVIQHVKVGNRRFVRR